MIVVQVEEVVNQTNVTAQTTEVKVFVRTGDEELSWQFALASQASAIAAGESETNAGASEQVATQKAAQTVEDAASALASKVDAESAVTASGGFATASGEFATASNTAKGLSEAAKVIAIEEAEKSFVSAGQSVASATAAEAAKNQIVDKAEINIVTAGNVLRSDGTLFKSISEVEFLRSKTPFERSSVAASEDIFKVFAWDNFIRPNNENTIGVSNSGQNWIQLGAFPLLGILDNAAYGVSSSGVRAQVIQRTNFGGLGSNGQGSVMLEANTFRVDATSLGVIAARDQLNYIFASFVGLNMRLNIVVAGVQTTLLSLPILGSVGISSNSIKMYLRSRTSVIVSVVIQSEFQGGEIVLNSSQSQLFSGINTLFVGIIKPVGGATSLSTINNFKATNLFRV
jgi:hypothetical protein